MASETLQIRVDVDGEGKVRAHMQNVGRSFEDVDRRAERTRNTLLNFRNVLGAIGAGFTLRHVVNEIGGFQQSMSGVQAVTQASQGEMAAMQAQARELGATTLFSGQQAAEGMRFLGQAGFDTNEIISAMPSTLALATAAQMDLASTADIASNVLQGFRMEASDTAMVADVLADAASATNTNVRQIGDAAAYVAPQAASLGVELSETAAAIGVLSDAGIQGQRAGTGLRGVLASLVNPTGQAGKALEELGLTTEDVDPQVHGLTGAMTTLAEAGLDAQTAQQLFGREAATAAIEIANQTDKLGALEERFQGANGRAQEMADTMADNLPGDMRAFGSATSEVIQQLGDGGLSGGLRGAVQRGTVFMRVLGDMEDSLNEEQEQFGATILLAENLGNIFTVLAGITASRLVPAMLAWDGALVRAARSMRVMIRRTGVLRGSMALLGGPAGIIAGAVTTLGIWAMTSRDARADTDELKRSIDELGDSYDDLGTAQLRQAVRDQRQLIQNLREEINQPLQDSDTNEVFDFLSGDEDAVIDVQARMEESREELAAATERLSEMEAELNGRRLQEGVPVLQDIIQATDMVTAAIEEEQAARSERDATMSESSDEIQQYIADLNEQIATLGMSEAQQTQYRASQMASQAATEGQANAVRILSSTLLAKQAIQEEELRQERELQDLRSSAQSTLASLMTQEERLAQTRQELQSAYDQGLLDIDEEEFNAAMERLETRGEEGAQELTTAFEQAGRNIQSTLADELYNGFDDGLDGMLDSFLDVLKRMAAEAAAAQIMDQMFGGQDPSGGGDGAAGLAALFGSLFNGGSALGGTTKGGFTEVNEQGMEMLSTGGRDFLMMSGQDGRITPNHRLGGGGGGGPTSVQVNQYNDGDFRGTGPQQLARYEAMLMESERRIMKQVEQRLQGRPV